MTLRDKSKYLQENCPLIYIWFTREFTLKKAVELNYMHNQMPGSHMKTNQNIDTFNTALWYYLHVTWRRLKLQVASPPPFPPQTHPPEKKNLLICLSKRGVRLGCMIKLEKKEMKRKEKKKKKEQENKQRKISCQWPSTGYSLIQQKNQPHCSHYQLSNGTFFGQSLDNWLIQTTDRSPSRHLWDQKRGPCAQPNISTPEQV